MQQDLRAGQGSNQCVSRICRCIKTPLLKIGPNDEFLLDEKRSAKLTP